MTKECPKCGRNDFKTEAAMKSHYGQVHDGSIAGVTIECDYCGKLKEKRQKKNRNEHEFCSRECYGKWRSENLSGENSASWEGRRITIKCDYCGSPVEKHAINVEKTENNFCDQECLNEWKRENLVGENAPGYDPDNYIEVDCDHCGDTIVKDIWKIKRNERNFCDEKCYSLWQSENRRGEAHPRWQEETNYISYGGSWPKQREKRLEKDGYECVVCSKSNAQEKVETGRGLSVHHITKAQNFIQEDGSLDEDTAHRLENLITLCSKCHNRWEGIPLKPEVKE